MTWPLHRNAGAFLGLEVPPERSAARFAVLPIPFDGTSTWQKGADKGPAAILEASAQVELYDLETASEPWRSGILTMAPVTGHDDVNSLAVAVESIAGSLWKEGLTVCGLGGDHSVSIGLIRAAAARYPGLTVLQLDAHADTREAYEGSPLNHACVMARAREEADIFQVGIRSLDGSEVARLQPERVVFAHEFSVQSALQKALAVIRGPVYLTLDLDCLDPSEMPATGTPEPGGLRYREVTGFLRGICAALPVVGFDIVELMPQANNRAPDFLAARLAYQIMAYVAQQPQGTTK